MQNSTLEVCVGVDLGWKRENTPFYPRREIKSTPQRRENRNFYTKREDTPFYPHREIKSIPQRTETSIPNDITREEVELKKQKYKKGKK